MIMMSTPPHPFPAGQILMTPAAQEALLPDEVLKALRRHLSVDWGDCSPDDAAANDEALRHGARVFSVFHTEQGTTFWIITEADRSATTVFLPEEY